MTNSQLDQIFGKMTTSQVFVLTLAFARTAALRLGLGPSSPRPDHSQENIYARVQARVLQLVWGPPGAGKTHFLASLINRLLYRAVKEGRCAPRRGAPRPERSRTRICAPCPSRPTRAPRPRATSRDLALISQGDARARDGRDARGDRQRA